MQKKKVILIIGGHDPTSGAGISADIETANYFNFHSLSILTCSTIQNTSKVIKVNDMPKDYIYNCYKESNRYDKITGLYTSRYLYTILPIFITSFHYNTFLIFPNFVLVVIVLAYINSRKYYNLSRYLI